MNDGGLNEYLSDRYGTLDDAEDMQKSAEAEFFAKLAEEEGIDLDSLEEDELMAIADALGVEVDDEDDEDEYGEDEYGEEEEGEEELTDGQKLAWISKVAEANEIDLESLTDEEFAQLAAFALDPNAIAEAQAEEEEFEAKMAEADFLGRTMAHAQFDELQKIAGLREMGGKAMDALRALKARFTKGKGAAESVAKEEAKSGPSKKDRALAALKRHTVGRYQKGAQGVRSGITGKTPLGDLEDKKTRAKAVAKGLSRFAPEAAVAGGAGTALAMKTAGLDSIPVELDAEAIALLEEAGYEFE